LPGRLGFGVSNLVRNPVYFQTSSQLTAIELSEFLQNPNDNIIQSAIKNIPGAKKIAEDAQNAYQSIKAGYEVVKSAWGGFSNGVKREIMSFTSKPVEYINTKFNQVVSWGKSSVYKVAGFYNANVKPLVMKYIQPTTRWIRDSIVSNPVYKFVNSNSAVNKVTSTLGWLGNRLGLF
jgi:hypothetical protein